MTELITITKTINAGSKKVGSHNIEWPKGQLEIESFANVEGVSNAFAIKQADQHTLQHDVSTFWRNNSGDLSKLPDAPTAGYKLWYKDGIVHLNHDFEPGEKGADRISIIVEDAIRIADLLTKDDPSNPVTAERRLRNSGMTPRTKSSPWRDQRSSKPSLVKIPL